MTKFLLLNTSDRSDILNEASAELGISPQLLEKDVWVCWTLEQLFSLPGAYPMAFKGGTSLSKGYGAISRFSEDVDVTVNWTSFSPGINPFPGSPLSSSQRNTLTNELRDKLRDYSTTVIQ